MTEVESLMPVVRPGASVSAESTPLGVTLGVSGEMRALVWAPLAQTAELHIVHPVDAILPMSASENGYFADVFSGYAPGTRYFFRIDGADRPDPASRFQPLGVHGPSEITKPLRGQSPLPNISLDQYVIYELHVGTFTPEGTFRSAIEHLRRLKDLGITAVELMPIAEFPGGRNWGYDGVFPFAADSSYGGVTGLHEFVEACHHLGFACILDVVYNHLGPEGNYFPEYGPYFTSAYQTPWGDAINFDGPQSDAVRRFFFENAMYWIFECGMDALRLDAIHAIYDRSATPFLRELADHVHRNARVLGRRVYLIAESDLNDPRVVSPEERGGLGIDAQWSDEYHHALHSLLTGEQHGYYRDFGQLSDLAEAIRTGWVYSSRYSTVRGRRFGASPSSLLPKQLITFSQNHDQIGNRMKGERLAHMVGLGAARVAAAAVLLSPYIPLIFMGEEYAEPAPFLYHVDHGDKSLVEAVRQGRQEEFASFREQGEPPFPDAEETFRQSILHQNLAREGDHAQMHAFYGKLLELRRTLAPLREVGRRNTVVETFEESRTLVVRQTGSESQCILILHFGSEPVELALLMPRGNWTPVLQSSDARWGGAGKTQLQPVVSTGGHSTLSIDAMSCALLFGELS